MPFFKESQAISKVSVAGSPALACYKALSGPSLGTFWRYRVGDYRLICVIQARCAFS